MTHQIVQFLHFIGIALLVAGLAGAVIWTSSGQPSGKWRKIIGATHGIGFLLVFIGGFGSLGTLRLGFPWPGWVWGKFIILFLMGVYPILVYKRRLSVGPAWLGVFVLCAAAIALVVFKPF